MSPPGRLSAAFLSGARHVGSYVAEDGTGDGLELALTAYVTAARAARPELTVNSEAFVHYLGERVLDASAGGLPPQEHAGDLLLACACASGLPTAVQAFHRSHQSVIGRVLARRRAPAELAEDVAQTVYERLLVNGGPGKPAKIAEYRGTGPLRSWVATAAATTLLMTLRAAGRRPDRPRDRDGSEAGTIAVIETASPELLYLKERYKAEIARAIVAALAQLDDRQRTLLRLHLQEGMSIDQLGSLYGVNRATAARWLATARAALVEGARNTIRTELHLSESQYESIVALVRSELDLSIVQHLSPASDDRKP